MKLLSILFCICLGGCLDFGHDLELLATEVTDKELAEVTRRTGIKFPEGTVGLGYYFQGSGIDDALALKASIPDGERLDFLKNEIFEKGDKSKCSIQIGKDRAWWKLDELKERVDRKMDLPKGRFVECVTEGATHVVRGKVLALSSKTQKSKADKSLFARDRIFKVTMSVNEVEKGKAVKTGDELIFEAWQPSTRLPLLPGPQGHQPIPAKGDQIKVYLLYNAKSKTYHPYMPNGIVIDDDKGEGVQAKKRADGATSLTQVLDNAKFSVTSETSHFSFSPVNSNIIYCEKKGVMSMDGATSQTEMLLKSPEPDHYLWAWMSPDGKRLLVLSRNLKLVLVDIGTGKKIPLKEELPKGFKRCAFSPDGTYFVAIGGMEDSVLLYWELNEDKTTIKTSGTSTLADCNTLYDSAFSPDGKTFATVSGSGLVDFWSRPPMRPVRRGTSITRNGGLSGIAFTSDGKTIAAAASAEPTITLVAPTTGKVVKRIEWKKGHPLSGRKLAFLPGTNVLATADGDKIGFLDTGSGRSLGSVPAGGIVKSLEVSPDGRWLVAGTRSKWVVLWRLKD